MAAPLDVRDAWVLRNAPAAGLRALERGERDERGERGASLVALLAGMTIMFILMSAAVPSWKYVMKDAREEELLFRGEQIASAIERYQRKTGQLPPNLEILVQQRYLRKLYKDPFAKDGKWRLVRPGEPILPPDVEGLGGKGSGSSTGPGGGLQGPGIRQPTVTTLVGSAPQAGATIGGAITSGGGGIMGVASLNKDKSLRMFNGRTRYSEWLFMAGQPRMVGRQFGPVVAPNPFPQRRGNTNDPSRKPSNNR